MRAFTLLLAAAAAAAASKNVASTTCADGSPSAGASWCDVSLPLSVRAELLTAELDLDEKLALWSPALPTSGVPRLNLKGFMWDNICIHGAGPYHIKPPIVEATPNVTVTAHAINLGATFDLDLVRRVSNMTAREMRGVTQAVYQETNGTLVAALMCDGGPLANSAHDPRWGRISETYGEDPYLISRAGTVATRAMQGFVSDSGSAFDGQLATATATRHFLGYHGANDMPLPQMNVTAHDLHDHYLPPYQSLQAPREAWTGDAGGRAEAIMCSSARFQGTYSCAAPLLLKDVLRQDWRSDALVQTDCCDSISDMVTTKYASTWADAVTLATVAGTQLRYSTSPALGRAGFKAAIEAGALTEADLDANVARALLLRFRLGEFEPSGGPYGPVSGSRFAASVDSPAHRALARETARASCVLLHKCVARPRVCPASCGPPCSARFAADSCFDANPGLLPDRFVVRRRSVSVRPRFVFFDPSF